VTMAAGFRCADGVVLCADTEMTIPRWLKYRDSKIRMYGRGKLKCQPVFAFAGDAHFCGMFMDKLARRISGAETKGEPLLPAIADEALLIHQKFARESYENNSRLILSLLGGAEGKRRRYLCEIFGGVVSLVPRSCQGSGVSVTQSMVTELFSPDMPTRQAAFFVAYMLAEAKAYGYGVGKDSQILLLFDSGRWALFPDDPYYPSLEQIEGDYIRLKQLLKPVILAYSDIGVNEAEFQRILADFSKYTATHRQKRSAAYQALIQQEAERQGDATEECYEDVWPAEREED